MEQHKSEVEILKPNESYWTAEDNKILEENCEKAIKSKKLKVVLPSPKVEEKTKKKIIKTRGFAITDFECDMEFWETQWASDKINYLIVGKELTEDKKDHFQCFVYFTNARSLDAIRKLVAPRHIEKAGGTPKQNAIYCKKGLQSKDEWKQFGKDGVNYGINADFKEWGDCPAQGNRTDIDELKEKIFDGEIKNELELINGNVQLYVQYNKSLMRMLQLAQKPYIGKREIIITWGPPSTGKTLSAIEAGAQKVILSGDIKNPFISGYDNNEECVLFDDFDPTSCSILWWQQLVDDYACIVNTKGGCKYFNAKKIYFTSNYHPYTWWDARESITRRMTNIIETEVDDSYKEEKKVILHRKMHRDRATGIITYTDVPIPKYNFGTETTIINHSVNNLGDLKMIEKKCNYVKFE